MHHRLTFSVEEIAGYQSELASLLAGFVFAGMLLLLSIPPKNKEVKAVSAPLYSMLSVFFAFVVASFLFALTAGDNTETRTAVDALLANLVFSVAIVQMFLSLVWFFKEYDVADEVISSSRGLFYAVVFITVFFVIAATGYMLEETWRISFVTQWRNTTAWMLPVLILAGMPLFIWFLRKLPYTGPLIVKLDSQRAQIRFSEIVSKWLRIISPGITLLFSVYFGVVVNSSPDWMHLVFPIWMTYPIMTIMGIFFLLCELSVPEVTEESADQNN